MVSKLILHIGYPKTATTTLQENLFSSLHSEGKINYLGRTTSSTHTRTGYSKFNGVDLAVASRKKLLFNQSIKVYSNILSSVKINLISDEDITFDPFFNQNRFGSSFTTKQYLETLKEVLQERYKNDIQYKVLLVIRNQTDLVFSCFLQKVRFIKPNDLNSSFDRYIDKLQNDSTKGLNNPYDFLAKTSEVCSIVDAVPEIMLFEDIKYDKKNFSEQISSLIGVDPKEVIDAIQGPKKRERAINSNTIPTAIYKPNYLGKLIEQLYTDKSLLQAFEERWAFDSNILQPAFRKMLFAKYIEYIPKPSAVQASKLKTIYRESNQRLASEFRLDDAKMKTYNYW